jgi:ribonuclease Z
MEIIKIVIGGVKIKNFKIIEIMMIIILLSSTTVITSSIIEDNNPNTTVQSSYNKDNTPPTIMIVNPTEGYLHFSGLKLFPTILNSTEDTMGYGGFRLKPVQVQVEDDVDPPEDITVYMYVKANEQGQMKWNTDNNLFERKWIGPDHGVYTLNITAEDTNGNIGFAEMQVGYLGFYSTTQETLMRSTIMSQQQKADEIAATLQRTDRITTILCGTSAPTSQTGTQTCTAVFVNGQFLVFDSGDDSLASMQDSNLPMDELDAVFITHFHNDHISDLGDVMEWSWILGRRHILPVYGPTGITQIVEGFESVYALDVSYRVAHHGEEIMPPEWVDSEPIEFVPPTDDSAIVIYEQDGVVVKAFTVYHPPIEPAVGYRIEYAGKIVVISGDTVLTDSLLDASYNADLLVADVMNKELIEISESVFWEMGDTDAATILYDIREYHMDVSDVGTLAHEANVKRLALSHLAPQPQSSYQQKTYYQQPIEAIYAGEIIIGEDGLQIIIPINE